MKVNELLQAPTPLLEGKLLDVYNVLLPHLLIQEEGEGGGDSSPGDGGTPPDVTPSEPPVQPPGGGGWYRPGPFRPGGMGLNGNHWFNQLYSTLKNLVVASNILKRLKELGIKGDGANRVKMAAKTAAKHVKLLLANPGATAYRIPVWTTAKPTSKAIRVWNEAFAREFEKELAKIPREVL